MKGPAASAAACADPPAGGFSSLSMEPHGLSIEAALREIALTDSPCRCRSKFITNSLSLITDSLPARRESIGKSQPPGSPGRAPRRPPADVQWVV